MSDPYAPQPPAWGNPPPNRTPWIIGAAVVGVILLAGVTGVLIAGGVLAEDTGSPTGGHTGGPTAQDDRPTEETTDTPATAGTYVFADDVCARLDFAAYRALGDLADSYTDRGGDYGDSATLGCDFDFGDGGELRVEGMLAIADKTAANWDFATGLLAGRTQETVTGAWEEGLIGVDETWGAGKTDAILAVRDGNLVVTVAFYSINDGVGYDKVESLLPSTAAALLAAAEG